MSKLRFLPFLFIGFNLCAALLSMAVNGATSGTKTFFVMNVVLALVATTMFLVQRRGIRARIARAEAALRAVARSALDAPAEVRPGFESSLVGGAGLRAPGGKLDAGSGFTVEGTASGVATKIATLVSTTGRQMFELSHTYSYVTIDRGEAVGRLRIVGRDMYAKLQSLPEQGLGDRSFDAGWIVVGDVELTGDVLDAPLRKELIALQARAYGVSQLGMSIELTGEGLVVRWPGELDETLAVTLRDLALRVRERLLHVLRAKGLIAGVDGVRIQAAAGTIEAEAEAEAAAVLEAQASSATSTSRAD